MCRLGTDNCFDLDDINLPVKKYIIRSQRLSFTSQSSEDPPIRYAPQKRSAFGVHIILLYLFRIVCVRSKGSLRIRSVRLFYILLKRRFLFHNGISQTAILISVFVIGFEYSRNGNLGPYFRIVVRIRIITLQEEFYSLRATRCCIRNNTS